MKKLGFLFVLLFASLTFASFTEDVSTYARQYESGEINLLQFNVLLLSEREKLFRTFNEDNGFERRERDDRERDEGEYRGWNREQMQQLFGEPTQTEQWAWSPILRRSIKLSTPAPAWRKPLYEGEKLRVILDSWPQVIQNEEGTFVFYHFDMRPEFKNINEVNVAQMVSAFKNLIESSQGNEEKVKQSAFKAVEFERALGDYLHDKELSCKATLQDWFGQNGGEVNKLKWSAIIYDGESVTVQLNGDESSGDNWHWLGSWVEIQHRVDLPPYTEESEIQPIVFDSVQQYTAQLREIIGELKRTANNFDSNPSRENYNHLQRLSHKYQNILQGLMNRVSKREIEVSNDEAITEIEKIFSEQTDFTKESVKQFEFKQSLYNLTREVTGAYCSGDEVSCGEGLTCSKRTCVESTCRDLQCGECQYPDRTTCTCTWVDYCVPRPIEEQRQDEWESGGQGEWQNSQNQSNQTQPPEPQQNQTQVVNNETQPTSQVASNQSSTPPSQWGIDSGDGSCNCPPNPAPTCEQGYSAVSTQYQYNSSTCTAYVLTCWRTTCQSDRPNTTVASARTTGLYSLPYLPLTGLSVEQEGGMENQPPQQPVCPSQCSANQYCAPEKGWCECKQGFFDCDGDWQNGCESTKECKQCKQDSDCAPPRCSEDHGRVVTFQCKQSDSYTNQVASAEFGGNCGERNSGEIEAGVWFSAWGEGFEQFDFYKQQAWSTSDKTRCEAELEDAKRKRMELQESLDNEFFEWFFDEFVSTNPNDFEEQGRSIGAIYEAFQQNSDETARALRCLDRTDWPSEYREVRAEIKTDFGKVEFWEEKKRTRFWGVDQEIFSPYMKIWIFPTKEMFKRFFAEKIREEGPEGPTPEELAEIRQSPEAMEKIRKISGVFGGDARIIVQAIDNGQSIVKFIFIVNERDLIKIEPADTYDGPISATVSVSLDFIYDVASSVAKEMEGERLEVPYWEQRIEPSRIVNDGVVVVKLFGRIFSGILNGEISISPPSTLPKVLFILQEMMTMIMSETSRG